MNKRINLVNLLYGDDNEKIPTQKLIADIDIDTPSASFNIDYEEMIKASLLNYDKLMMVDAVHGLISPNIKFTNPMTVQIINHNLDNDDIITSYKCGYKTLHNNTITGNYDLPRAVENMMHVKKLMCDHRDEISDDHISLCTSL